MCSQLIIKVVGLIYKLYLTNREGFGDHGNAIYAAGFQIYALLLTVSSIGVPNAVSKLVSSRLAVGDNRGGYRIFKVALVLFSFLGFLGSFLLFTGAETIAVNYLQIPDAEMVLVALSPSIFLVSVASVFRGYFNGRGNLEVTANSQTLEQILKTIFTIAIVNIVAHISSLNVALMAAGATLATTTATAFSLLSLYICYMNKRKMLWQETVSSTIHKKESIQKIVKSILLVCVPITATSVLSVATKSIDAVTVVRILQDQIGEQMAKVQYGMLGGKVDMLISLPFSFNIAFATALVPAVSSYIARGKREQANKRIELSLLLTMLIGLPAMVIMSMFSEQILLILFPNAPAGSEILSLSAMTILFVVLMQTVNGALQGLRQSFCPRDFSFRRNSYKTYT